MHIQRKFNMFVEGFSTHMIIEGVTPPSIKDAVEDLKGGGLLGVLEVPLSIQKLEAAIKVNARAKELMKQVGLRPGSTSRFTLRSVNLSEVDASRENEVIEITGRLNADWAEWNAGSVPKDGYKIGSIPFYRHTIDGKVIHHVDILNTILVRDGVDEYAKIRGGLGY